jgi:glycosyltransferase involved in cell wall biosynthesis
MVRIVPEPPTRTLILLAKAPAADAALQADRGEIPRIEYVQLARSIGATILDFHDVDASRHPAVKAARARGPLWGLAALGMTRRREFDQFYVTGEDIGMPFGMMMRAARDLGRITMVVHHGGTPKRRLILRAIGHSVYRNVIVLAERQREILVSEIGYPALKVHRFDQWLDAAFYRPLDLPAGDYVFSCGRESRDYPLLERAAALVPHRFRVVASGWAPHAGFAAASNIGTSSNLEVLARMSYTDLREAYARARLVAVPIDRVDYAAGVTGLCEAMAMGKAVVATDSPGIRDYVLPGTSGLVVPIGDERALARAIDELVRDPERCARMGAHNRAWVERVMNVDRYVERVRGLFGMPS